jgi:hypothetical protein
MTRPYFRLEVVRWAAAVLCLLPGHVALCQTVVISEFMARNAVTLLDSDGDSSDWVELYNSSSTSVSLEGWALTDDSQQADKWRFPALDLEAGKFLVVFASGKDRRDPEGELHTIFRLSSGGEFLGLVSPTGVLESHFAPTYPEQLVDASYGFPMLRVAQTVVGAQTPARLLVPQQSSQLDRNWQQPEFDDSAWTVATGAIGYDRKEEPTVVDFFETDVASSMLDLNASAFLRIPLAFEDSTTIEVLELRVRFDGGFLIYLNGIELLRENVVRTRYNSSAGLPRSPLDIPVEVFYTVAVPAGLLLPTGNVLAVHAQNDDRESPEFLFALGVDGARADGLSVEAAKFFSAPTPGWLNWPIGQQGQAAPPEFSVPGGSFTGALELTLESDSPNAVIRYRLNGPVPTERSDIYHQPLTLTAVTRVTARAFEPGKVPSDPVTHTYLAIDEETRSFTSDLPIVLISSYGRNVSTVALPMHIEVINVGEDGRASITGAREFVGDGVIKERGSSSAGRPKKSYSAEIRDLYGRDEDVEILGLPADSDFVLYAAYNFDRALMRNPLMYRLANSIGRYAVRDRFCEVFVESRGGLIDGVSYAGVYSLFEKIGRGEHRVDVESLPADAVEEPDVTGGYILKIDRPDPGDTGFVAGGVQIRYVYPKEAVVRKRPEQVAWIRDYFTQFAESLRSTMLTDSTNYSEFIDVRSWIDHQLLNEFAKNPDGYVLSTYFYKPRGGKVHMGPIWDFDRTIGPNDDERARSPIGWSPVMNSNWWGTLLNDEEFLMRRSERWLELRNGPLATQRVLELIEEMRTTLRESQVRNFAKWRLALGAGGWEGQVDHLSEWVADRLVWMDGQLTPRPRFSHAGGFIESDIELTLSVASGSIYYTVNGPDPRAEDGTVAPEALVFEQPISIASNTRVRARTRIGGGAWSGLASVSFAMVVPDVLVTEIMFNPPRLEGDLGGTTNFEFFELFNAGEEAVDLAGWTYRQDAPRVLFDFSTATESVLQPGEYGVVVRNLVFFRSRYGDEPRVLGQYTNTLSNVGDRIFLEGPLGEDFLSFEYRGDWYELAGGGGHSLLLRQPPLPRSEWSTAAAWEPSARVGGSPGRSDTFQSGRQRPGDISQDGTLGLTDAVLLLRMISGTEAGPCQTAAGNQTLANVAGGPLVDFVDALRLLNYLFLRGVPPEAGLECVAIDDCPEACAH